MLGVDAERGHPMRGGWAVGGRPVAQMGAVAVNKCVPVTSSNSFVGVHKSQAIAAEVGGPGIPGTAPSGLTCEKRGHLVTVIRVAAPIATCNNTPMCSDRLSFLIRRCMVAQQYYYI